MGRQQGAGAGPAGRAGAGSRGGNYGGGGRVRFRGRGGRGRGGSSSRGRGGGKAGDAGPSLQTEDGTKDDDLAENAAARDEIDEKLGFGRISAGPPKVGWLVNMSATTIRDEAFPAGRSGVDFYFIEESGSMFKSTVLYEPYLYLAVKKGTENQVEEWLMRKYEEYISKLARQRKEDLKLPNHLLGYRRTLIQVFFRNMNDLYAVRRDLLPLASKNRAKVDAVDAYAEVVGEGHANGLSMVDEEDETQGFVAKASRVSGGTSPSEFILDIREYDVPYYLRVAIDKDIRVGLWYTITFSHGDVAIDCIRERVERAEPVVMAYDIETTKAPLKFPDAAHDQIMMISFMIDGQGVLITNREIVSEDIEDFEYTPKPEYEGPFTICNEPDEAALIRRFCEYIQDSKPTVMATYNGDSFDFPFLCTRATAHGIDLLKETGFAIDNEGEFKSRSCIHMDCFRWVKRDSYLPQGSQGLKAVTVAKLGYNPTELDPELMTPYAIEHPSLLAQYSVSDAVATYYLYMKYVHPFIFSLCNIIPLNPDEVLRKGSGTLCETLLMVEAYRGEVIMPNKHVEPHANMYEGHLLAGETYVGGHVEALEAGVFRSDISTDFKVVPSAILGVRSTIYPRILTPQLKDDLDAALKFSLVEEGKLALDDVLNYDEVKAEIEAKLDALRDQPLFADKPMIYHLDVAAMYPNIMLSNRLQPDSVVDEAMCAACDYNRPGKTCDRRMDWAWRGEYFPAKLDEFKMIRNALEQEFFPAKFPGRPERRFVDLSPAEQTSLLHKRLGDYSRQVYKKTHETKIVTKEAIICQRENPFYIDTVRAFRDRRYTYKGLHKRYKGELDVANASGTLSDVAEAKKMIVLYDSLQLAHKCILNSFYGYVMRKGARWYSMEMAGITCLTGARIIQMARKLVEQVGRPLELDTDGIWCMLPASFPDEFTFKLANGKKFKLSYPCTMLNHLVHREFTNDQYHTLVDADRGKYEVTSENSIFFELDGPYRAMILPSSKEEDKLLKKRYAVFNEDGTLAELKGFEVKRRGELQLIKIFQSQIFERFLLGGTLAECYAAVAATANQWLDVLATKAAALPDDELIELIAENRSMSKTLAEYAGQKSTSISTAKRLAEFLGEGMVRDKGLSCRFIISAKPPGAPVTERAIPVAIFSAEPAVRKHFLRKWLKDNALVDLELRSLLDWDYYTERLGSVIQKLITIPAAMQKVPNPVPRIRHPDWLLRRVANLEDKFKQHKIDDMFARQREKAPVLSAEEQAEREAERARATAERKAELAARRQGNAPVLPTVMPDPTRDYRGWLAYMKPLWRARRAEQASGGGAMTGGPRIGGLLGTMLRHQTSNMLATHWDLVQISDWPGRPGEFRAWLLIRDSLQCVRLRVPRQFYLNLEGMPAEGAWPDGTAVEAVSRTLPRGQRALNLVRVSVPEDVYVREDAAFALLVNRPEVDGVYELQLPLVIRALLHLGTSCVPERDVSLSKGLDRGFDLGDLARAGPALTKRRYLNGGAALRYAYLYHAHADTRHMIGLFTPEGRLKIHVVERTRNPDVPNLERYYADQLAARREAEGGMAAGVFEYVDALKIDVTYHTAEDVAFRALSRDLNALGAQRGGPTALVAYSAHDRSYMDERIAALAQYPVIMVQARKQDNTFEALSWKRQASYRMIQHYLRIAAFLRGRAELADRFDVPLGNLDRDPSLFLADLDFARRLVRADMLLWWSPSLRPDLGGREADANAPTDDLIAPEVTRPGCYTSACLEVDVRDLAIDAVLQSALVYELEGAEGATVGFTEASHTLDEYAKGTAHAGVVLGDAILPTQTFAILKGMVKAWWTDAARGDVQARSVMDHFYRWVSTAGARMFDPAIHRFLHGLMRKTFSQLLAEFRRLGAEVVHADFGRLILRTSKPTASAAYAYANYIISSVNARELYKYLQLSIRHHWEILLWMDAANFAGVICRDPSVETDSSALADQIDMSWNLGTFLPPAVQVDFVTVIGAFVTGMLGAQTEAYDTGRTPLRVLQSATQTQADPAHKHEADLAATFVRSKLQRQMLRTIQYIDGRHRDEAPDEELRRQWAFPTLPGALFVMTNPVLEFIKSTCAIFALAKDVQNEVGVMRRHLLELIGVKEFAQAAVFKNPAMPFRVPVVCAFCSNIRTLDLTRDPELLAGVNEVGAASAARRRAWPCDACSHPHDRGAIEATLIEGVMRQIAAYQLQDLRCLRCRSIKSTNLRATCECAGAYSTADARSQLARHLAVTAHVASYYGLDNLGSVAEWASDQMRLI